MSKKKKPTPHGAQAVEGQIIKIEFNCLSWIGDVPLEKWTRGPILPVGGAQPSARNGKRGGRSRKKKG